MKKDKWLKLIGVGILGLAAIGPVVPVAKTATTATVTATVQDQACQGGDLVNVTLTAVVDPPVRNARYSWDFNNDGIFDTAPSTNPTVTHAYPDEANITAVVKVQKGGRTATDSVSFVTLRCGG